MKYERLSQEVKETRKWSKLYDIYSTNYLEAKLQTGVYEKKLNREEFQMAYEIQYDRKRTNVIKSIIRGQMFNPDISVKKSRVYEKLYNKHYKDISGKKFNRKLIRTGEQQLPKDFWQVLEDKKVDLEAAGLPEKSIHMEIYGS